LPLPRDGAPRGTCLRPGLVPWGEGFGIPNRSPDPLVRRAGQDHPFPISAGSDWRERESHVGWDTDDLPSQGGNNMGIEPHLAQLFPTAGRLRRLIVVVLSCRSAWGASVTPHPLRVARSQSRGLASSSCRRRRRVVSSCRSACGACTTLPQPRVHLCQPTM
jgi:hypothetical protein